MGVRADMASTIRDDAEAPTPGGAHPVSYMRSCECLIPIYRDAEMLAVVAAQAGELHETRIVTPGEGRQKRKYPSFPKLSIRDVVQTPSLLHWAVAEGCVVVNAEAIRCASEGGYVETLEWIASLCHLPMRSFVKRKSASIYQNPLEIFKWLWSEPSTDSRELEELTRVERSAMKMTIGELKRYCYEKTLGTGGRKMELKLRVLRYVKSMRSFHYDVLGF